MIYLEMRRINIYLLGIGDDGDDPVIVSDSNTREVCYGRLDGTKVNAHSIPTPSNKSAFQSNVWPTMRLSLKRLTGKDQIIRVLDPAGKDFGNVDVRTSVGLARIMDSKNPRFRTQAILLSRRMKFYEYCLHVSYLLASFLA